MKKKIVSVLLCAAMAVTMLAGCGSKEGDSKDGAKEIVYWSMWSENEPQAKVIKEAIEKYEKDTGVKVNVEFKGRNGQREGLEPALQQGKTIDVFDEDVDRVNGTWGSYCMDLEELSKDYVAEHANEKLIEIARQAGGGTLKTIPYQPSLFGFFYNKALFAEAGIDAVPTTWEEFDAVCAKLKAAGITPITLDDAYATSLIGYHFARYMGEDGVKDVVQNGKWDEEGVLKAANDIADFAKKGYFSEKAATNVYPAGQNQEFAAGKAAIIVNGSWLPNEVKGTTGDSFEWGYFNYPSVNGGKDDNTCNNIANQVMAINKDSKVSKEAFELIQYIVAGDADKAFVESALCIPADKANVDLWPKELTDVKAAFDATTTRYTWACQVESNNDATADIKANTLNLVAGKIDGQGFVDAMKKATK